MPLDAAEFISELSIVDPPGTDPLNQGDDHIRTTKKAVQQSFPNVNAAVPQTAAQMAQMAIKNENNIFTLTNEFQFVAQFNGTAARCRALAPTEDAGLRYIDDGGFLRWSLLRDNTNAGGNFTINRFDAAGAFQDAPMRIEAATGRARFRGITFFDAELRAFDGSSGFPSYTFETDPTSGMFSSGVGTVNYAASGVQVRFDRFDVTTQVVRLDMSEKIRFNNFNSNHGLTWRANGALTWELIAVHSNAPLTRLTFDRYVNNVFQDQPLQLHNDTGHVNMPVLPTGPGGSLVSGSLYAKQSQLFAGTELVVGVQP